MRWSYALRNRERWNTQPGVAREQRRAMIGVAHELGLTPEHFEQIAQARLVEVDVPWTDERTNWECRIFPWEFMLASVTRDLRGGQPLTAVRRLRVDRKVTRGKPESWLQVLSAPGAIAVEYDFKSEQDLLDLCVHSLGGTIRLVKNPDEATLAREVETFSPWVIHLTGVDSQQGSSIINPARAGEVLDGYFVRSRDREPLVLEAEPLARLLTSGQARKPTLISCNIYNSAARIAPLCVAAGAGAAIGFQDSFDDDLAELFFSSLYRAWGVAEWDLVAAFQFAWQAVRDPQRLLPLQGSGIVLWSEQSILEKAPIAEAAAEEGQRKKIRQGLRRKKTRLTPATVRKLLEADVEVIPQLNYSILHNNGPIFKSFRVRKKDLGVGRVDGLMVNVELHVGTDTYPFRTQTWIEETLPHVDLPDGIRVSLASALGRAIRESIHTSLFVEVKWQKTVLYRRTHRVTLLPVDEWRYDASNYRWLPSFVLPRDPAVLRIVDSSQRYLMALRDDATAGFDGYQSVITNAPPEPKECQLVDLQVRALWSALLYESPMSYINPPPTFTDSSQRLRTPSDCIDGKRGTCIDLALLLAACLEYVEIYPAIFLLKTHAFPAYWRHDSFHRSFCEARRPAEPTAQESETAQPAFTAGQRFSWDFQASQYREILGEVQAGRLVPLETTLVTGRGSFADAMATGVQNLASLREFESMLDIQLARTDKKSSVTPLPVRRGDL